MAIIKLGAMVVGIRGTIGGVTFSANKAGPYAQNWARGSNPRSSFQSDQRGRLAQMPAHWAALTTAQQAAWDAFASNPAQELTNALGEAYYLSGFGWFTKCNTRLLAMGRATITAAPTIARPSAPTLSSLELPYLDGQTAYVTYPSGTFSAPTDLVLDIAQAASVGRLSPPNNFRELAVVQSPNDTETPFLYNYLSRFGDGSPNFRGFARMYRQTSEGLRSSAGTAQFISTDASPFAPAANDYDGTTNYGTRGADLTGAADSDKWTTLCFFRIDAGDGTNRTILSSQSIRAEIRLDTANRVLLFARNAAGTTILNWASNTTFASGSGWHSLLFAVDLAVPSLTVYLDGALNTATPTTLALGEDIDFTTGAWTYGARVGGTLLWDGCLSQFWSAFGTAADLADPNVRRLFLSPAFDPLYQGAAGQFPTGTTPIIYFLSGDPSANLGSGGNFVNNAALSACSTAP